MEAHLDNMLPPVRSTVVKRETISSRMFKIARGFFGATKGVMHVPDMRTLRESVCEDATMYDTMQGTINEIITQKVAQVPIIGKIPIINTIIRDAICSNILRRFRGEPEANTLLGRIRENFWNPFLTAEESVTMNLMFTTRIPITIEFNRNGDERVEMYPTVINIPVERDDQDMKYAEHEENDFLRQEEDWRDWQYDNVRAIRTLYNRELISTSFVIMIFSIVMFIFVPHDWTAFLCIIAACQLCWSVLQHLSSDGTESLKPIPLK